MQPRIHIYGGRCPLLGVDDVGHALVPRPSSQLSPPFAVTVTTTPSDSSGIEPEQMEHAVDPSRCATNVP